MITITKNKRGDLMVRYQVIYSKNHGNVYGAWFDDLQQALCFVKRFRFGGYSCTVWEHTQKGARMLDY